MKNDRRLRRLVVDGVTWHWTVRRRVRPVYADCRTVLTLFAPAAAGGPGRRRRLSLVFAPTPTGVISNCWFESGTVIRLPDRQWLNLYEPRAVRRLLRAATPALRSAPPHQDVELDGWPCFTTVVG
ncbi:hypothetical protein [Streptomyces sp. NPDC047130]|uniref:hypothetical protein n=1 Tax=Streptomyces sp. NPDC047130 TaxID=3155261 RepID=UPI003411F60B